MKTKSGLVLYIMLTMALGKIKENQPEKIRSLKSLVYPYVDNSTTQMLFLKNRILVTISEKNTPYFLMVKWQQGLRKKTLAIKMLTKLSNNININTN